MPCTRVKWEKVMCSSQIKFCINIHFSFTKIRNLLEPICLWSFPLPLSKYQFGREGLTSPLLNILKLFIWESFHPTTARSELPEGIWLRRGREEEMELKGLISPSNHQSEFSHHREEVPALRDAKSVALVSVPHIEGNAKKKEQAFCHAILLCFSFSKSVKIIVKLKTGLSSWEGGPQLTVSTDQLRFQETTRNHWTILDFLRSAEDKFCFQNALK